MVIYYKLRKRKEESMKSKLECFRCDSEKIFLSLPFFENVWFYEFFLFVQIESVEDLLVYPGWRNFMVGFYYSVSHQNEIIIRFYFWQFSFAFKTLSIDIFFIRKWHFNRFWKRYSFRKPFLCFVLLNWWLRFKLFIKHFSLLFYLLNFCSKIRYSFSQQYSILLAILYHFSG